MSEVMIHCPSCGDALMVDVKVLNTTVYYDRVKVEFRTTTSDHECSQ